MMDDALNQAQRSAVSIVLRRFEEQLRQAEHWLKGTDETGTLYRRRLEIEAERHRNALDKIDEALHVISDLACEFDLAPVEQDLLAKINAEMTVCWADLHDTRSIKLRRYGDVDPRLAYVLDPRVDRLAELASELAALAARPSTR